MKITEQERKAIDEAAEKNANDFWGENYITENKNYNIAGFKAGAKFALSELRNPSEPESNKDFERTVKGCLSRFLNDPTFGINEAYSEIAKLAPFHDVNAMLLEALESLANATTGDFAMMFGFAKEREHAIEIIKKQTKP